MKGNKTMPTQSNIVYGMYSGLALLMDVHTGATSNGRGIIFISGSGWRRATTYDAAADRHYKGRYRESGVP